MIVLQRPIEPQVFHKNGSIRGESVGGFATAGTVSKRRCEYFAEASASTFFSEISSITSWPRARSASPTAMPGNKWPPVPPQAMRIFRDLDTGERVNSRSGDAQNKNPAALRREFKQILIIRQSSKPEAPVKFLHPMSGDASSTEKSARGLAFTGEPDRAAGGFFSRPGTAGTVNSATSKPERWRLRVRLATWREPAMASRPPACRAS